MSTATLGPRPSGWNRPVALPELLEDLQGPVVGRMRLPLRVYSSGAGSGRVFDLDDRAERIEFYQIVLTEGTVDDLRCYLNHAELLRLWSHLWLPAHVRQAWQPLLGARTS